jgi:uracil phosphoribosyltransferase
MSLPPNVHVSTHPCLLGKLSQLRSKSTNVKEVKTLVHEISLLLGCEALAAKTVAVPGPTDSTPLGFEYTTSTLTPETISLVPILRSGLGMVEGMSFISCGNTEETPKI